MKQAHARIPLKGAAWSVTRIAEAVEAGTTTVERVRKRFVEQGLEAALVRKPQERPSRLRTLDGRAEARLIALACSPPTDGRKPCWQAAPDRLSNLDVSQNAHFRYVPGSRKAI